MASDISKDLSQETSDKLRTHLESFGPSQARLTSVEGLRNWANTSNGCRLGNPIVTNAPVCCLGCNVDNGTKDALETRKGYSEQPKHMRWSAHGLTYGTVFLKTFYRTGSDGKRSIKEISTFAACNNCMDIWVGKLPGKYEARRTNLWPFKMRERDSSPKARGRQEHRDRGKKPKRKDKRDTRPHRKGDKPRESKQKEQPAPSNVHPALKMILSKVQSSVSSKGNERDPWKFVTLTMLKAWFMDQGKPHSGSKGQQISTFLDSLREAGEDDVMRVIAQRMDAHKED